MQKLTPNLIVDNIEDSLRFWVDLLGFEKTVEVPEGDRLGFVILKHGEVELMLQSRASLKKDMPQVAGGAHRAMLYFEVPALAPIRKALGKWPHAAPERTTFYGAREIIVNDPAGNTVCFATHGAG
jgi:catechol 2,3-dioxygenase-like lactoylglutathione lyase family enzyme